MHHFLQLCELWKVWCLLLSAGFLFTPLCPDSLLTLQFTLCGKQDRTLCVGFLSSWQGYRPPTKPDNNAQQPQENPTNITLYMSKQSAQKITQLSEDPHGHLREENFCNYKADRDLHLSLLMILKTQFSRVFAFVRNTFFLFFHKWYCCDFPGVCTHLC